MLTFYWRILKSHYEFRTWFDILCIITTFISMINLPSSPWSLNFFHIFISDRPLDLIDPYFVFLIYLQQKLIPKKLPFLDTGKKVILVGLTEHLPNYNYGSFIRSRVEKMLKIPLVLLSSEPILLFFSYRTNKLEW